jgi:ssDNA-specific exonuclease RecJ
MYRNARGGMYFPPYRVDPFHTMSQSEPDILRGATPSLLYSDFASEKKDLRDFDEETFQRHYKATKSQYAALIGAMEALRKLSKALATEGPLDIDSELIDSAQYLTEDIAALMQEMHTAASFWMEEQ